MKIRRRRPCYLQIDDRLIPDAAALDKGEWKLTPTTQTLLLCPFSGVPIWLAPHEVGLIALLRDREWRDAKDFAAEQNLSVDAVYALVKRQIVVGDGPDSSELRRQEDELESVGWDDHAALFHAQTRWTGQTGNHAENKADLKSALQRHLDAHGPPPPTFVTRTDALTSVALPAPPPLAGAWPLRRTTRTFRTDVELPLADLAHMLAGVYGFRDKEMGGDGLEFLTKTSPSGGSLHPIEAYPFVAKVAGLLPGLYHYRVEDHRLEFLASLPEPEVREWIATGTAGQRYFANTHAAVLQVVRFDRAYWKYRRHPKIYKALLMDAAHLSQSWYLMAAERSLGAWVTAAINDGVLGDLLKLDPLRESALAFNGLGVPDWSDPSTIFGGGP